MAEAWGAAQEAIAEEKGLGAIEAPSVEFIDENGWRAAFGYESDMAHKHRNPLTMEWRRSAGRGFALDAMDLPIT